MEHNTKRLVFWLSVTAVVVNKVIEYLNMNDTQSPETDE